MLRLLKYLVLQGVATKPSPPAQFPVGVISIPKLCDKCVQTGCNECLNSCPTSAITLAPETTEKIKIDLGKCIACSACIRNCPDGVFLNDSRIDVAVARREQLIIPNSIQPAAPSSRSPVFERSIACRVVSTGCSACDLELSACGNAIFDMERFGISVVASPRFADVLLVTGPVPKAMHEALRSCYEAMSEPRKVIAVGTCAISGGVHAGGYTEANGVDKIIPVDAFIPGCPPHPWSILQGIKMVMGQSTT